MPEPLKIPSEAELGVWRAAWETDDSPRNRLIDSLRLLLAEHEAAILMDQIIADEATPKRFNGAEIDAIEHAWREAHAAVAQALGKDGR